MSRELFMLTLIVGVVAAYGIASEKPQCPKGQIYDPIYEVCVDEMPVTPSEEDSEQ